jgi:hypothetical protein
LNGNNRNDDFFLDLDLDGNDDFFLDLDLDGNGNNRNDDFFLDLDLDGNGNNISLLSDGILVLFGGFMTRTVALVISTSTGPSPTAKGADGHRTRRRNGSG